MEENESVEFGSEMVTVHLVIGEWRKTGGNKESHIHCKRTIKSIINIYILRTQSFILLKMMTMIMKSVMRHLILTCITSYLFHNLGGFISLLLLTPFVNEESIYFLRFGSTITNFEIITIYFVS